MNDKDVMEVNVLIVSSTIDYSTDLVCCELERRGCSYLRINRDLFGKYNIVYDIDGQTMSFQIEGKKYIVNNDSLKSIFFRAPVFFRYSNKLALNEQLYRSQWGAFIRNLIVFDKAKWINHPVATYRAENKMLQLQIAKSVGMRIPKTFIGNHLPSIIKDNDYYIVKALDAPIFYDGEEEMFTYSTVLTGKYLTNSNLKDAPVILQEYLTPKIDYRVTVVNDRIFPTIIQIGDSGIEGDWRKHGKSELSYIPAQLPNELEIKLHLIMDELGLTFGGIDLALCGDEFYFIEVNPTGEWGWLVKTAGHEIHKAIADYLEAI